MKRQKDKTDTLKEETSKELGVFQTEQNQGWSPVSTHSCGNMVRNAIDIASRKAGNIT